MQPNPAPRPERAPSRSNSSDRRPAALQPSVAPARGATRAGETHTSDLAEVRGAAGGRGWLRASGLALVAAAALALTQLGAGPVAAADDASSPEYARHQAGGGGAPVLLEEDRKLTRRVQRALLTGADLMIPGDPLIPPGLVPELTGNDVTWCRVTFFDNCAEDGDWISVHLSNGMVFPRFPILHAGHQIAIPVKGGVAPVATIVAEVDGAGGVTVAAVNDDGVWHSAVLPVGGTQMVPVRVR